MKTLSLKTIVSTMLIFSLMPAVVQAQQTCGAGIEATTPTSRFTNNNNGTVTDNDTGLMWQKCSVGQAGINSCNGFEDLLTWKRALEAAESSTANGYSDWRLPNIKELASIVELKCINPAINTSVFPDASSSAYWSSTPYNFVSGDDSYTVGFADGSDNRMDRNIRGYARLVRDAQ